MDIRHWIVGNGISVGWMVKLSGFWKYDFYQKIVGPFWDKGTLTCFFGNPEKQISDFKVFKHKYEEFDVILSGFPFYSKPAKLP